MHRLASQQTATASQFVNREQHQRALVKSISKRAIALILVGVGMWGVTLHAADDDGRHAFAVERIAIRDVVKAEEDAGELALRFKCPVEGEYVVVVVYSGDLQGIDAQFPQLGRPFAGLVTTAMGVDVNARVIDVAAGKDATPESIAPTVFGASTKRLKWSGERLAVFRLKGGCEYRLVAAIKGASPQWMSLNPVLLLDPSDEVTKSLAWRTKGRTP